MYVVMTTQYFFSLPIFEIVHRKIRSKELNQNREIAIRDFTIEKQIARGILCNKAKIYQTPLLYATQIINAFHNSIITANQEIGEEYHKW